MYIADLCFQREDKPREEKTSWVKFGKLWYETTQKGPKASLFLPVVHVGSYVARPRDQEAAPFMDGELSIKTDTFVEDGEVKGRWCVVGYIQTKQDAKGIVYFGRIFSDPSPVLVLQRVKDMVMAAKAAGPKFDIEAFPMNGIWISIFLNDKERGKYEKHPQNP